MKKAILIPCIVAGAAVIIYGILYLFVVTGAFSVFMPNPPKPQITYAEFPFTVTYEVNGEEKILQDTIICEYDGIESFGTGGKENKWKTSLKSRNDRITLLDLSSSDVTDEDGHKVLEVYVLYGSGAYYMGDTASPYGRSANGCLNYLYRTANGKTAGIFCTEEEAYEKYHVRLISWDVAEPIMNTFEE